MGVNIQTIKDISVLLYSELNNLYPPEEIRALSNIVTAWVTGRKGANALAFPDQALPHGARNKVLKIVSALKKGQPLQYILGETEFYNCLIRVNPYTLIPRPETEELADLVIRENRDFTGSILDIGTGSGCIAIALSVNIPLSEVKGIDISAEALKLARQNNTINKAGVTFLQSDIFSNDFLSCGKYDIIVSNPPYVRDSEKQRMHKNVLLYEPATALFVPDNDPLVYYRRILEAAEFILNKPGTIYFEINEAMGNEMAILARSFGFTTDGPVKDINGRNRLIKCCK